MQKRIFWIDSIKGLAMFSVVLCHVVNGYYSASIFPELEPVLYGIQNIANSFQMALFCMASGFLFHSAYCKEGGELKKEKVKKQILTLLSIYILWCIIMGIFKIVLSGHVNNETQLQDLFFIWCRPIGVYWYLFVLIILYLIFWNEKIRMLEDKYAFPIFGIIGLLGSALPDDFLGGYFLIRRVMYYSLVFYLGIQISKRLIKYLNQSKSLVCGISGGGLIFLFWESEKEIYHIPIINLITALLVCFCVFGFFSSSNLLGKSKLLCALGKNSLDIYLLHVFFTAGIRMLVQKLQFTNAVASILLTLIMALFLPVCVGYLLKKIHLYSLFFKPYLAIQKLLNRVN